jgi:thiamine kinase-like enzyme
MTLSSHGDLHPGNILVEDTGKLLKLHLLDCGLVIEMGPDQHKISYKSWEPLLERMEDWLAGQLMVDKASKVQASDLDVEGIEQICIEDDDNVSACVEWLYLLVRVDNLFLIRTRLVVRHRRRLIDPDSF